MKMVTDPTLDDDRWGLFVMYKRKFWFEENGYDVPESYFYRNGEEIKPNTIELVKKFLKQVRESRGYDVDFYPPPMFESPFSPLPLEEMRQGTSNIDKRGYARVVGAAELAIQDICEETGHRYKLVKVERAVHVLTRPWVYLLTLTAEEDGGPVQTIQAEVCCSINDHPVLQEWRFKPLPAQNACYVAVQTQSKFDADKAKRSIQKPPMYALRAGSGHVRALNIQFASWTQSQLQNHPDEPWDDGVQDYLNRAKIIIESYGDAVNWLRTNAVKGRGIAKIPSEDARTKPLWKRARLYNKNGHFTFGGESEPGIANINAITVASNGPDGGCEAMRKIKKALLGSQFDADSGETSIRRLPLNAARAKSPEWHVRSLNIQFASWIQSQLQNHPDELWEDGVDDYLISAKCIRELYRGTVHWLRINAVKRRGIAKIPSEDARTKPLFGIGKSSHTLFRPTLFSDKPMFPAATTASSGTPWRPALLFNNGPSTFGGSEVSVPGIENANVVTSNEPDVGGKAAARCIDPGIMTIVLKNSVLTTLHTLDDGDSNENVVARPFLMENKD
ncbi:Pleckstrin homology (PH) domain superfamily protein [Striga hermonthica]|uniref:Pleckstrin homology (PH) domain superfamily protein n=1 Tax=Striga hermonthica TaxID=68872 RepID=A0A9N7NQP6_STRHE|nr:Pleckstrin homology (PH) domain superfamily protein [Striga hermonthica]